MSTMRNYFLALLVSLLAACSDRGGYIVEVKPSPAALPASSAASDGSNLILPLEVDQQVAETFVKIAYGLNKGQRFQSTEFLTPTLRTSQAAPLIRLIKKYNEFDGVRVAAAVEKLKGRISGIEFGREGSPVLYIDLPYWSHQREEAPPNEKKAKISDAENDRLVDEIKVLFVSQLKAYEFSTKGRRVRIWWD
jgi:hypothetical protein